MHEAVIVSTARTPIATAFKGTLVDVDPFDLATHVVADSVQRAGIDPLLIDDVVMGESLYGGGDIARYSAIEAGLVHAPGVAHNRHCASSLAAVQSAAASDPGRHGPGRGRWRGVLPVHLAPVDPAGAGHRRLDGLDVAQPPRTRLTPPTWTCPSPWAGTPPSVPGSPGRRWTPGPSGRTSGPWPPSTPDASPTRSPRRRSPAGTGGP